MSSHTDKTSVLVEQPLLTAYDLTTWIAIVDAALDSLRPMTSHVITLRSGASDRYLSTGFELHIPWVTTVGNKYTTNL